MHVTTLQRRGQAPFRTVAGEEEAVERADFVSTSDKLLKLLLPGHGFDLDSRALTRDGLLEEQIEKLLRLAKRR
jgi:hypothetical protein